MSKRTFNYSNTTYDVVCLRNHNVLLTLNDFTTPKGRTLSYPTSHFIYDKKILKFETRWFINVFIIWKKSCIVTVNLKKFFKLKNFFKIRKHINSVWLSRSASLFVWVLICTWCEPSSVYELPVVTRVLFPISRWYTSDFMTSWKVGFTMTPRVSLEVTTFPQWST